MIERLEAAEAEERQRMVAGALLARGLEPGDRLGIVARSGVDLLVVVLGALRRGIIPVLINPILLRPEQDALLADAEPALVVRDDEVTALAGGDGAGAELAPVPLARPMHYTSGTSGAPKGVWSGLLDEGDAAALVDEERELWGFAADDVHLVCSPLHHSAPVRFAAGTLLAGGTVVLLPRFDPVSAAEAVSTYWPTTAFMAPAHLQRLRAMAGSGLPDPSSFRLLAHAGAPCPEPLKRWALDVFPPDTVWEFYGSTEGQFTACPPGDWLERPGTVGRARPHRRLEVDTDGVVWCGAPGYARFEYWRDRAKTAAAWRDDAFTVFDLGRLDAEGYLFLDARRDDLVISGGVNVYPAEVERVLASMPDIGDVAVFGIADERWGERVCAAVTGPVEPEAVIAFARANLASYKCPKQVVVVPEIPHTPMGKLRRSTLADDLGVS